MLSKIIKINEYIDDIYKWNESATISLQTIMIENVSLIMSATKQLNIFVKFYYLIFNSFDFCSNK